MQNFSSENHSFHGSLLSLSSPMHDFVVKEREVHVVCASLRIRREERVARQAVLSRDELLRASRFHFPEDRDRFVTARGLLRTLLGRFTGSDPGALRFRYGLHGKPSLESRAGTQPLMFNVSHSCGLCLLAFSRGREVGVDVEYVRPSGKEEEDIITRFFSPAEAAALGALPPDSRRKEFFTFWARKEAYIKARGLGAAMDLRDFDVSGPPDEGSGMIAIRGDKESSRWSLTDLNPAPGYAGAVAAEGRDWQVIRREWVE